VPAYRTGPVPDPYPTTIEVAVLNQGQDAGGGPKAEFDTALTLDTKTKYCNSDAALNQEAGLPLPKDYGGGAGPTGC
jgi:hypothetical protein